MKIIDIAVAALMTAVCAAPLAVASKAQAGEITTPADHPDWMIFEGEIVKGDGVKLDTALKSHPKVTLLILHSNGGLIQDSFDMLDAMDRHGERGHVLNTYVGKAG